MKTEYNVICLMLGATQIFSQGTAITFQNTESEGINVKTLDSLYQSAHT